MKPLRRLILIAAVALLPRPLWAQGVQTGGGAEAEWLKVGLMLVLLPHVYVNTELPRFGFTRYPYETPEGYGDGERDWAPAVELQRQSLDHGRTACHAVARVRHEDRLGYDLAWSGWQAGALASRLRSDQASAHLTAGFVQTGSAMLEYGLGGSFLRNEALRGGPSAMLNFELHPHKPLILSARYHAAFMSEGRVYHQVSVGAGVSWRLLGLGAGYRASLNPLRNERGPEFTLNAWF